MRTPFALAVAATTLLAGCGPMDRLQTRVTSWLSPVEEVPLRTALAPIPDRWAPPAELKRIAAGGQPLSGMAVRRTAGGLSVDEGDGCRWQAADWFAPATSWAGCGTSGSWRNAHATVRQEGRLWPLEVGNVARFHRTATNTAGATSTRTRTCQVVDQVGVVTRSKGVVETSKVRCTDGRRTRTTWWSEDWGPVAFDERYTRSGRRDFWRRAL